MDICSSGIPGVFGGKPLFCDATMVSPLKGNGRPISRAHLTDGRALEKANHRNAFRDYPDVHNSSEAKLLCLGVETFGRWDPHCIRLIRELVKYRSLFCPILLQKAARHAWQCRWWAIMSTSVQTLVADSILRETGSDLYGSEPSVRQVHFEDAMGFA